MLDCYFVFWEQVFLLVLEYLRKSETSPFKKMSAIFARKEYQKDKGNLSHSHLMVRLDWSQMSEEETEFVKNLSGLLFSMSYDLMK